MKAKGIFFDLDGTLIFSLPDIAAVTNRLRRVHGLADLREEQIRDAIGEGVEQLIRRSFQEILERRSIGEWVTLYRESYTQMPPNCGWPYPGVSDTLKILRKQGFALAVVTNKPTDVAEENLSYYLPEIVFDYVAGPERVSEKKPSGRHILEVSQKLNVECVAYVGDHDVDKIAAREAGVPFYAAHFGFGGVAEEREQGLEKFADLLHKPFLGEV